MRARALLLLPALLLGCGGAFAPAGPEGDAGSDADGTHESGPGTDATPGPDGSPLDGGGTDAIAPWSPVCPASTPALGSACTSEGTQCEYGDAWWSVSCDVVVACQQGQWQTMTASYEPCSQEPGPNANICPPSYASVPQGSTCGQNGLSCVYAQAICSCALPLGGPVEIDGGTAFWGCVPEQGCPMPRPRLGSACPSDGVNCTYEQCSYAQTCAQGVWQAEEEGCASAGSGGAP